MNSEEIKETVNNMLQMGINIEPSSAVNELDIDAALKRTNEANTPESTAALESIREQGDASQLMTFLEAEHEKHRKTLIQLKREMATVAYLSGDIDNATKALESILSKFPDDLEALTLKGWIYKLEGHLDMAQQIFTRVLEHREDNSVEQAQAYANLGNVYQTADNLSKASKYYRKSLEIHIANENFDGEATDYANLGYVYKVRENFEKARKYLKLSLKHFTEIGATPMIEKIQNWIDELPQE